MANPASRPAARPPARLVRCLTYRKVGTAVRLPTTGPIQRATCKTVTSEKTCRMRQTQKVSTDRNTGTG